MKRTLYIFLLFILLQVLAAVVLALVYGSGIFSVGGIDPVKVGIATLISEVILIGVLIGFHFTQPRPLACFAKGMPKRGGWALLAFLLLAFGMSLVLVPFHLDDFGMTEQFEAMSRNWLCLIALCVVAPMAEEFVFREGIQRELRAAGYSPLFAILLSAALFGAVHGDPAQMVPAVIMGAVLGCLYQATGDLRLCLPAHILNNTVACIEMSFPDFEAAIDATDTWVLLAGGAASIIISGALLWYALRERLTTA